MNVSVTSAFAAALLVASGTRAAPLHGVVRGPAGPVAGARVKVIAQTRSDLLKGLACPDRASPPKTLRQCACPSSARELLARLTSATSPAPVAEATTDSQGAFDVTVRDGVAWGMIVDPIDGMSASAGMAVGSAEPVELRLAPSGEFDIVVGDESGASLPGASAFALSLSSGLLYKATTQGNGRLHMGPVPPGTYDLVAFAAGLQPEPILIDQSGRRFPSHLEVPNPKRPPVDIRLGGVRTFSGAVLEAGKPVAGALVELVGDGCGTTATTDRRGRFKLLGSRRSLLGGIEARKGAQFGRTKVEGAADPANLSVVLAPAGAITGAVRNEKGSPIAGATVSASWRPFAGNDLRSLLTQAGPDGTFRLAPLEPGEVELYVVLPGRIPQLKKIRLETPGAALTSDLVVASGVTASGTVVDATGRPVRGASVWVAAGATTPMKHPVQPPLATTVSDAAGRFDLAGVVAGRWELTARHADFIPTTVEIALPNAAIRIVLEPLTILEGTVVDVAGTPQPGVQVSAGTGDAPGAFPGEPHSPISRRWSSSPTETDPSGRFGLKLPGPGTYDLRAVQTFRGSDEWSRSAQTSVEIPRGEAGGVRIVLAEGPSIGGVVVDENGKPLTDVRVSTKVMFATTTTQTDSAGRFLLRGIGEAGSGRDGIVLTASKQGYTFDVEPPPRARPGASDVRLVLTRRFLVRGRVLTATGYPARNFTVNGTRFDGERGEFALPIRLGGDMLLEVREPSHPSVRVMAKVDEDRDSKIPDILLTTGRTIAVTVVDSSTRKPLESARVEARSKAPATGQGSASAPRPANQRNNGPWTVEHAPEGDVVLTVTATGYTDRESVVGARSQEATVVLERESTIAVQVVDGRGAPAGDVNVTAEGPVRLGWSEPDRRSHRTSPDGRVAIPRVAAGRWQLSARPPGGQGTATTSTISVAPGSTAEAVLRLP